MVEPTITPTIPIPSRPPESVLSSGTVPSSRSRMVSRCLLVRRLGPVLALAALLQGCLGPRQTLHVVVVPAGRLEWLQRDGKDRIAWTPLLQEYQRLHPGVQLQLSVVPESELEETLRLDRSRGLGPDLLVLQASLANALLQQGLVERLNDQPAWHRSQPLLEPALVDRVTSAAGVSGLPAFNILTLACFNR